jgi:hypothetical protein
MFALESTIVEPNLKWMHPERGLLTISRSEQITEALHPEFGWYWSMLYQAGLRT